MPSQLIGVSMLTIRKLMMCAAVPLVLAFGATANAQGVGGNEMYVAPSGTEVVIAMDKLAPGQRDQVVQIKTRMMQMEMEHREAIMQVDTKYQRSIMEMQMQLLSLYRGH
ncbi:hypothetical protein [Paraburkholderia sp. 40]|uniref:hypothetical protein n=1 Tax=Paraburkholderia sp. 40 TaxID=2991059 RepID=UPI003D1936C7